MYKALYGESSTHTTCVDGDQNSSKSEASRCRLSQDNLSVPSIISQVDKSKKRNYNQFHGINFPLLLLLRNWAITGCGNALQSNVVGSLLDGVEVAAAVADCWWFLVGPQIPNHIPKLRSDHSLPLPRISPTSITYAESYAYRNLFGADLFWSCRLKKCI